MIEIKIGWLIFVIIISIVIGILLSALGIKVALGNRVILMLNQQDIKIDEE